MRIFHVASRSRGASRHPSGCLLLIHNIGAGTQEVDVPASLPLTGHYRFKPINAI